VTEAMQFTLTGLDEKKFPLANLLGKVVVFDFWATCAAVQDAASLYEEAKKKFKDRSDVVFLSIDTDEDRSLSGRSGPDAVEPAVYFDDGSATAFYR